MATPRERPGSGSATRAATARRARHRRTPRTTTPLPVPTELLQSSRAGVTADQAGARAAQTSWSAKASMENLRSAAARVDEAWAAFLPRLSALGKYTRLEQLHRAAARLQLRPAGTSSWRRRGHPAAGAVTGGDDAAVGARQLQLPFFVLDNWLLQATLTVPISDYFLRIDQNYTAATHSQEAARWDVVTRARRRPRRTAASRTTRGSTRAARSSSPSRRSTTRRRTCATRATSSPRATRPRPTCCAPRRRWRRRSSRSSTRRTCPT